MGRRPRSQTLGPEFDGRVRGGASGAARAEQDDVAQCGSGKAAAERLGERGPIRVVADNPI